MENKLEMQTLVYEYIENNIGEIQKIEALVSFLMETSDEDLYTRKNFNGHITSSAFVLDETLTRLLLINHKKLNRWLQPGGHVDETDSNLVAAAIRETTEETGLPASSISLIDQPLLGSLFDIDSHVIPENNNKNEPSHIHHDCRFLFQCHQSNALQLNANEATDYKWTLLTDLYSDDTFGMVARKITRAIGN